MEFNVAVSQKLGTSTAQTFPSFHPHRVDDTAIFQNLFGILMHLPRHLAQSVQIGGPFWGELRHGTPLMALGRAKIWIMEKSSRIKQLFVEFIDIQHRK